MALVGRRKIYTDVKDITDTNVIDVVKQALSVHQLNRNEIDYLYRYYKGDQPVLERVKDVRPEIVNRIVENRANEIVSFKTGYLVGEPIQYISLSEDETVTDHINTLNRYMAAEDKDTADKELAEWFHICGTSYRMVMPDENDEDKDEAPFEIYTLDPRDCFVVYYSGLGEPPVLNVKYIKRQDGVIVYSVYTKDHYFEITDLTKIEKSQAQVLGLPIIEYPLNAARLGAFEIVLSLLDAINNTQSNRVDGVEQFVQALMLFHNVDISATDYADLKKEGALKYRDIDPQLPGEIKYLVEELNQGQTQTLKDDMYNAVLTICGMPNRNGGRSTSDTGAAVIMRDGWSSAEARAKDTEKVFKRSERAFLRQVLHICKDLRGMELKLSNLEIHFTRRNYENIVEKANVLTTMLNSEKIAPQLAFQHCGLFIDPEMAYQMSKEYAEEREEKNIADLKRIGGIGADKDKDKDKDEEEDDVRAAG